MQRRCALTLALPIAATMGLSACGDSGQTDSPAATTRDAPAAEAAAVPRNPLREAYFGETHVHTLNSPDAFIFNVRSTPDDAYRFALGQAIEHASGMRIQLGQPLDFIAVTDHSEYMGILPRLADPDSELADLPLAQQLAGDDRAAAHRALMQVLMTLGSGKPVPELVDPELRNRIWQEYVELAEYYYRPGEFTTFVAYEWTSSGGERGGDANLHRNVIFRGAEVPERPFSSLDSYNPRDLWQWMDEQRAAGIEVMAIPHNSNLSDGLMFPDEVAFDGEPLDAAWAELRLRNEPIVEMTQIKGTSETHPALSPNDEWADFELLEDMLGGTGRRVQPAGGYVRDAWLRGMRLEEERGFNPYRFGVIGASDSHNASSPVEESNYHGKIGMADGTPERRRKGSFINELHLRYGASGLAGVWAESNTREDIYDAMARRETFATTGPRIRVRFFGGRQWSEDLLDQHDWLEQAYASGVPMGGDLPAGQGAPEFLLWAAKDPASAWLQRLQIVKGWIEDGEQREQVYDVACSDGLSPDPDTHRCPDNGASVSLETCDFDRERGDSQLRTQWRDPDFNPAQRAFYYVRVLENPTCRWSTWDSLRNNLPLPADVPATIQERAYTSPIWYRPQG